MMDYNMFFYHACKGSWCGFHIIQVTLFVPRSITLTWLGNISFSLWYLYIFYEKHYKDYLY
jgi:hypothetical protein